MTATERVEAFYRETIERLGERKWPGTLPLVRLVEAAESAALEQAAQEYGAVDLANIKVYCRHVAQRLREMKSPAAAHETEPSEHVAPADLRETLREAARRVPDPDLQRRLLAIDAALADGGE